MGGSILTFNKNKVSVVDLNTLVDLGFRFTLKDENECEHFDDLDKYLKEGINSVTVY